MKKEKIVFEPLATRLIDLVRDPSIEERIFGELCSREPKARELGRARFSDEYTPARLALGCGYWKDCCEVHGIEDKGIRNVFFKEVMKKFKSPEALAAATRFSESLYAANAVPDESPALAIMGHLSARLDLPRVAGGAETSAIAPGFVFLIEACEALKNMFGGEFDDFIYSQDDFRV